MYETAINITKREKETRPTKAYDPRPPIFHMPPFTHLSPTSKEAASLVESNTRSPSRKGMRGSVILKNTSMRHLLPVLVHDTPPPLTHEPSPPPPKQAANLVESNERLIDARTGAYGYRDDAGRGGGRGGGGRGGGRDYNRGGRDGGAGGGGGRGSGDWGGGRGYTRPGQTANNRYQGGGRGRGGYGGRGAGNYIRERRDMGVGPRR